ncbi:MAG: hypothetical protein EXR86_16680 [Gammaproteobacteria bacterium]|nr:hypothetical protein [Gammaproteobacteria bacterium]
MSALSHRIIEGGTRGAIDCVAALRSAGHTVGPSDTRAVLDEFVFVQLHFVDRAANAMLTIRTQDLFLPSFISSTLWLRFKTQAPVMGEEEAMARARELLPTFDSANQEYASSSMERPADATALRDSLAFRFGTRVAQAAHVPTTGGALITCMNALL